MTPVSLGPRRAHAQHSRGPVAAWYRLPGVGGMASVRDVHETSRHSTVTAATGAVRSDAFCLVPTIL